MGRSTRGAALTEFAIVVPVFLALVYGSIYLAELGVFRLRAQEIARFGAWAFTQHPLSAYDDDQLRHQRAWVEAQGEVRSELWNYMDFDAATSAGQGGTWGKIMAATYEPLPADLRNLTYDVVPEFSEATWAEPLTELGMALTLLGVGTSVQSMFNGIISRLHMNTRGLIAARANVNVKLPMASDDAELSTGLAKIGKVRGADLSRWASQRRLRDAGKSIETTLLVDSWRITEGFSGLPDDSVSYKQFKNAVHYVSENGVTALPGGPILSIFLSWLWVEKHMPYDVGALFGRLGDKKKLKEKLALPAGRLVARPYSEDRDEAFHKTGPVKQGQIDVFAKAGGKAPAGAVTNFETAPFFSDPERPDNNPYLKALNMRGPNFMGCNQAEKRGCWE